MKTIHELLQECDVLKARLSALRHAFFRQAENDIEALARFRYQAFFMIFDLL